MNRRGGSGVNAGRVADSLIRLGFAASLGAGFANCSTSDSPKGRETGTYQGSGGTAAASFGGIGGGANSSGLEGGLNLTGGTGGDLADAAGGSGGGGASSPLGPPSPTPIIIDECPGSLDAATVQSLQSGGGSGARLLYPYDRTVFPVGLLPPLLQWQQSGSADAVYLHMKSALFEYKGCFGPNSAFRLSVPTNAWANAGRQSGGATDPLTVELKVKSGGAILGMSEQLIFALGKLKGDLFYNTYTSPQAANNGAVMKLHLGDTKPQVLLTDVGVAPFGPCWSCHSLSAKGGVLVAQHHQYPGGPYSSASFDLLANPTPQSAPNVAPTTLTSLPSSTAEMGLGAVYPDGSKVLTTGSPGDSSNPLLLFPDAPGNVPGMIGPKTSRLLDVRTGAQISMSGWNVQYAQMPSFSPDGSLLVFNWHEDSSGHSLAIAQFDTTTNTVSNVRVIYKHATLYPGWPWITPDNQEVVFVLGNKADFVSGYPGRLDIAVSDLWTVDVATGQARPLARANGYPSDGAATYLPQPSRDEHLEFFPTMSPIAAGGYFWVFFTSRRTYGNTILQPAADAVTKKIWVSAFNIRTGDLITDPSNPPFYLPGQEEVAGNIRAFAALEPCHADGDTCESGVDCCIGHCYNGTCRLPPPPPPPEDGAPPPPPCSNIDESCTTSADCCDPRARCVGGYCTFIEPR